MPKGYDDKKKADKIDITPKPNSSPPPTWDPRQYKNNVSTTGNTTSKTTSNTNIGAIILIIIVAIIAIGVTAWVWSANEHDAQEIHKITCEQYNLTPEECERSIEEGKARAND
jgi:uncharacterized protein HemX